MSNELAPTEWNKAALKAQAELAKQGVEVEVKTIAEILGQAAKDDVEVVFQADPDLEGSLDDDDYIHPNLEQIEGMASWAAELDALAKRVPDQFNHYGWLVSAKVKDHVKNALTEAQFYVEESRERHAPG